MGLKKDVAYPLTLLFFSNKVTSRKANIYEPKAQNETMQPTRKKKSITISYTQYRTTPILTPISTKKKEWGRVKKWRPTPGARKSKQRKKTGGKLKENKLIKLN